MSSKGRYGGGGFNSRNFRSIVTTQPQSCIPFAGLLRLVVPTQADYAAHRGSN
jgi:hypothetical protein